ncbi:MAG: tetratricopeptide repeat protein [Alphaproteobacteria bacterium]|nr:tetratricopeptide repeat protein [Alphaproteobacteria bacterium]MDD9919130.1 tetratricopeptide repeat protein [Alphaproteobacteria bacterium]
MRFLALLLCLLPTFVVAENLPSLPSVDFPTMNAAATGDPTFARKLEDLGDINSAILEWQRIAHSSSGAQQAYALLKLGRLALNVDQPQRARAALERFMTTFPKHKQFIEALYLLSLAVPTEERGSVLRLMERVAADSPWTQEAIYHAVWDHAETYGFLPEQDYTDPRIQQLSRRLQDFSTHYPSEEVLLGLAILPGGAHLWFGDLGTGFVYLALLVLLLWIICYAYSHRHWPYIVWWSVVLLAIMVTAFNQAQELALEVEKSDRSNAMAMWTGLHPTEPTDK